VPGGVYRLASAGRLTGAARAAKQLVYVPSTETNQIDVIDPATYRVIRRFPVGREPQHVVPSWDLRTLWVNDDQGNDLVPIDPTTGRPGRAVPVADPYNLYFTPDGRHALVMAERQRRIDVRDPHTMRMQWSLRVPCRGVNHADFTPDGRWMLVSCEFSGKLLVIPNSLRRVESVIDLNAVKTPKATDPAMARSMGGPAGSLDRGASAMPQDVRITNDGRAFVVADMLRNGVWVIGAAGHRVITFVPTGRGAHGIYPSRDARRLFVSNRDGASISVLDAGGRRVLATWRLPRGSSPDMGGVSADGARLWLSGRYDSEVYVVSTSSGRLLHRIKVDAGPHGLAIWPQPGRHSLGHTGNMR
jgi:YVTN family beta-propeller protein